MHENSHKNSITIPLPSFSARNKLLTIFFVLSGLFLLAFFFLFTLIVRADTLRSFDFDTTVRLQNITPLRIDPFFSVLSVIGRFEWTAGLLALVLLARRKITGIIIFGLFGFAHVVEVIGKTILEQPGPPNMFLRSTYSEFPGLYVHTNASYPSGHSLRAVFLGILFSYLILRSKLPWIIKLAFFAFFGALVSAMLYSRITLGEHWTTDVIGGTILGLSMVLLSLVFIGTSKAK